MSDRKAPLTHFTAAVLFFHALLPHAIQAQTAENPQASRYDTPFDETMRTSRNLFYAYRGERVPPPSMANSSRLTSLIRDGKLYISLRDAIDLALEGNLDIVVARYNLPIAQMDVLRTEAGGLVRGVDTGVISGTPGGGAGTTGAGGGAGGTSTGAGGAGTGAGGLVQSTFGLGTIVSSYDPYIQAKTYNDHTSELLPNRRNLHLGRKNTTRQIPLSGSVRKTSRFQCCNPTLHFPSREVAR